MAGNHKVADHWILSGTTENPRATPAKRDTHKPKPEWTFEKNEKTKIYSYVDFTNTNDITFTPNELTQYRNTILILKKEEEDAYKIWSHLSENDKLNVAAIAKFLKNNRDTLIARFLESDTHSTAHIITPEKYSERIKSILSKLNIEEIKSTKLYEIINKF